MASDQAPLTEAQLSEAVKNLKDLREDVSRDLADNLGGDPEDYRSEEYLRDEAAADGGD
ncbi:MAG: hypothetical protein ABEJ30_06680 [Halorientalis sp.]